MSGKMRNQLEKAGKYHPVFQDTGHFTECFEF